MYFQCVYYIKKYIYNIELIDTNSYLSCNVVWGNKKPVVKVQSSDRYK